MIRKCLADKVILKHSVVTVKRTVSDGTSRNRRKKGFVRIRYDIVMPRLCVIKVHSVQFKLLHFAEFFVVYKFFLVNFEF